MAHRYRLYPTPAQEQTMSMHCAHARFVWNLALEQTKHARQLNQYANQNAWDHQLAEARQNTWLGEGSSIVQQQALRDLRQAFVNWWKNPIHFGPPSWRTRKTSQGFRIVTVKARQLSKKWGQIKIPKAGWVRFRLSRPLGEHQSARVTLDRSGRWHVSFSSPQSPIQRQPTGAIVGIDRGVTHTLALSDGRLLSAPTASKKEIARKRRLQRKMSRQVKGSNRREATRRAIAKLAARDADRRKDWIEKTSTMLVREHDVIAFEALKVKQMMRSASGSIEKPGKNVAQKRGLNRAIASQGWSMLATRTKQKAEASGVVYVEVPAAYTSRRCSCCGELGERSGKSFVCKPCDRIADADTNASENILAAGLAVAGRGGMTQLRSPDETSTTGKTEIVTR